MLNAHTMKTILNDMSLSTELRGMDIIRSGANKDGKSFPILSCIVMQYFICNTIAT